MGLTTREALKSAFFASRCTSFFDNDAQIFLSEI